MTSDPFERAARHERQVAQQRTGFHIHFGIYVAVNLMLAVIWAVTPHAHQPLPWFLYPLMGWGIGIVAHYLGMRASVSSGGRFLDHDRRD